jgi:hypothetical protein
MVFSAFWGTSGKTCFTTLELDEAGEVAASVVAADGFFDAGGGVTGVGTGAELVGSPCGALASSVAGGVGFVGSVLEDAATFA